MSLTEILLIVRRFWWLVALPTVLALLLSLATFDVPPRSFWATADIVVTQATLVDPTDSEQPFPDYNNFHSWAASEYIVDDLPQILPTELFAADLRQWLLDEKQLDIPVGTLKGALTAERAHRIIKLRVKADDPGHATAIAEGVAAVLDTKQLAYWDREDEAPINVQLLDVSDPWEDNRWRQPILSVILRTIFGFAAGLLLAFIRYYYDPAIRSAAELEREGLPVLAEIPSARR